MKISKLKKFLGKVSELTIQHSSGMLIPPHFHITEAGIATKAFIDCGGTIRENKKLLLQIWVAQDVDHRLTPQKLLSIIGIAEKHFGNEDLEVEVEYQTETVGKYSLEISGNNLLLLNTQTDCLAKNSCNLPLEIKSTLIPNIGINYKQESCTPGNGCC
ncbi:MAG: DUF6428 family protein [Balneolales bacterium]|nr:DUF6428 family protein [Balneolales bacterium]